MGRVVEAVGLGGWQQELFPIECIEAHRLKVSQANSWLEQNRESSEFYISPKADFLVTSNFIFQNVPLVTAIIIIIIIRYII